MSRRTQSFAFNLEDKVNIVEIKRPGIVKGISIDNLGVQYQVTFWNDSSRRVEWVYDHEITLEEIPNAKT